MLKWVGINLHLVNMCLLIKVDQHYNANRSKLLAYPCIFPHLLSSNHKCAHPCLLAVQRRTLEKSTSATPRSSEAGVPPVMCLWKMKMELRFHSYRLIVVKTFESNV
jgi:hypothetical protein